MRRRFWQSPQDVVPINKLLPPTMREILEPPTSPCCTTHLVVACARAWTQQHQQSPCLTKRVTDIDPRHISSKTICNAHLNDAFKKTGPSSSRVCSHAAGNFATRWRQLDGHDFGGLNTTHALTRIGNEWRRGEPKNVTNIPRNVAYIPRPPPPMVREHNQREWPLVEGDWHAMLSTGASKSVLQVCRDEQGDQHSKPQRKQQDKKKTWKMCEAGRSGDTYNQTTSRRL